MLAAGDIYVWPISPAGKHSNMSTKYKKSLHLCRWFFRRKNTFIPAKRKPRVRSMETVSPVTRKPLQKLCL